MDEMNLSLRLKTVVDYIPGNARLADIGSDHAYLPCYAFLHGLISMAIAGEVNEGPYQLALQQVDKLNLNRNIHVRKGNGLEVIEPKEVDCITIAGMGGQLITDILESGKEKLNGVSRLVLQPNVGSQTVRLWLKNNGWDINAESIIEEDQKIYEVIAADVGESDTYRTNTEAKLLFGPFLMEQKSPAFIKKWNHELEKLKMIYNQLNHAQNEEQVEGRKKEVKDKIDLIEGVLK